MVDEISYPLLDSSALVISPSPNRCVYCGLEGEITRDHIPPKKLFPKNTRNLITIPSCQKCNNDFSPLDNRFLQAMRRQSELLKDEAFPMPPLDDVLLITPNTIRYCENLDFSLTQFDPQTYMAVKMVALKIVWGILCNEYYGPPVTVEKLKVIYRTPDDLRSDPYLTRIFTSLYYRVITRTISRNHFEYNLMRLGKDFICSFQVYQNNFFLGVACTS